MHNPPIYLSRKVQFTTTEIWLLICSFTTCTKPAKSILITTMALWQIGAKCLSLFSLDGDVIRWGSVLLKGHTMEKPTNGQHRCRAWAHQIILPEKYGMFVFPYPWKTFCFVRMYITDLFVFQYGVRKAARCSSAKLMLITLVVWTVA